MIVRYVRPLTENQRHTLAEIMKHDAIPRARVRAHGILLSAQGMRIKEIAKIYQVDRDTVATWIKLTPCGRTRALEQRIPWSHRCILDTPAWACRRYILRGIWLRRSPHQ